MKARSALRHAVLRRDWEIAALYALLAFAEAVRDMPDATIDDLLAVLTFTEDRDDRRPS